MMQSDWLSCRILHVYMPLFRSNQTPSTFCLFSNWRGQMISFYIEKVALEQVSLSQARLSPFALYFHPLRSRQNTRNKDIKGITVCGNEIKICQYADDTMILDGKKVLYICLIRPRAFRCDIWCAAK